MAIQFIKRGPNLQIVEEDGKTIGEIRQWIDDFGDRRTETCFAHTWSEHIKRARSDGNPWTLPDHWMTHHGYTV